uniref:Ig-like domain-containing protein n=1 Tax=Scleropages formosus TaxID=113540 RepID=A0A8C9V770_SCLFO
MDWRPVLGVSPPSLQPYALCCWVGSGSPFEVLGPVQPVVAVAGEDVVLPCYLKPNISAVDLHVEWIRVQIDNPIVHLYRDHEDRNENQVPSYRGRTSLFPEELKKGNTSLKLYDVRSSDDGPYKCFVQSHEWQEDSWINLHIKGEKLKFNIKIKLLFLHFPTLMTVSSRLNLWCLFTSFSWLNKTLVLQVLH